MHNAATISEFEDLRVAVDHPAPKGVSENPRKVHE